jgi:hypothetical protein
MSDRFETNENYPNHVWDTVDRRWKPKSKDNGKFRDDAAAATPSEQAAVELECAANIKPEPIIWLWKDWLALGKLHILAGQPGVGKSPSPLRSRRPFQPAATCRVVPKPSAEPSSFGAEKMMQPIY